MATKQGDLDWVLDITIRTVDGDERTFEVDSADAHKGYPAAFTTDWGMSADHPLVQQEWPLITLWLRDRLATGLSFAMSEDPMILYQPSGIVWMRFEIHTSDAKTRDADALLQRLGSPQTEI